MLGLALEFLDCFLHGGDFLLPFRHLEVQFSLSFLLAACAIVAVAGIPALLMSGVVKDERQRHHLRIWHRPETFNGKEVWICAATHDIAIDFSQRDHTFIHRTDPEIDRVSVAVTAAV